MLPRRGGTHCGFQSKYRLHRIRVACPRAVADHFEWENWRFEMVGMDRNRVDKTLIARLAPLQNSAEAKS